jgi:quinol monooxygenase YgiN
MYGLLVTIRVHPGKGQEFEAAFAVQAVGVRRDEPGNRLYELMRSRDEPDTYTVVEIYTDEDAFKAHFVAPHMVANRAIIQPLIADRPAFQILDSVCSDL